MANQTANWNSPDYFRLLDEANNGGTNGTATAAAAFNQSLPYRLDGNRTDAVAKPNYETGSNFMLLLEDFGEYFYNYNGSGPIGVSNNTEFPNNCTNSTCGEMGTSKYYNILKKYHKLTETPKK